MKIGKENAAIYFWYYTADEQLLSEDDGQALTNILAEIKIEDITENKELAGITPEYGLHLIVDGENRYINQADSPDGQSEISFLNKQWWIESAHLKDFMCSFLEKK